MSERPKPIEIALGTILPGPRQFIKRVFVKSLPDPIDVEVPGQVLRCGDEHHFSILPYAQLVEREGPVTRAALLAGEVRDERGLDRAMATLREKHGRQPINGFAIRFTSNRTVGAALDASDKEGCGCGGGSGSVATLPATIAVGLRHDGDYEWTPPVRGRIHVFADIYSGDGSFFNSCHSVWEGWWDRSTICEGHASCGGKKSCRCDDGSGRPRFNCTGWTTCWCK